MEDNVCRFVPYQKNTEPISILHFVLETKPQTGRRISASYTLHFALEGEATLHAAGQSMRILPGDLFFTLPAAPYALETGEGFRYLYISFLGSRGNELLDRLKITAARCVFPGFGHLEALWRSGLDVSADMLALRSESILMYTFSEIGRDLFAQDAARRPGQDVPLQIRKYVDDHFSDPELSLEQVARTFSYNPKYVSTVFKRAFKVNFSEYLNILRVQHACTLMEQSFTCVKDIAALCGFKDSMYFSRVFKARMGVSPREHRAKLTGEGE